MQLAIDHEQEGIQGRLGDGQNMASANVLAKIIGSIKSVLVKELEDRGQVPIGEL